MQKKYVFCEAVFADCMLCIAAMLWILQTWTWRSRWSGYQQTQVLVSHCHVLASSYVAAVNQPYVSYLCLVDTFISWVFILSVSKRHIQTSIDGCCV